MRHFLYFSLISLFSFTVYANEFIERVKELGIAYNNCQFRIESISQRNSIIKNEFEARQFAYDLVVRNTTMARNPIHPDIIKRTIRTNTPVKLGNYNSNSMGANRIFKVKDLNNFSMFTYKQDGSILQVIVHIDGNRIGFHVPDAIFTVRERNDTNRWSSLLFEHEKILETYHERNVNVTYVDNPDYNYKFENDESRLPSTYDFMYQSINDFFPMQFNSTLWYQKSERTYQNFQIHDGKPVPMEIATKFYELKPYSDEFYLSSEGTTFIRDFKFAEQEIDWLVPPGVMVQNELTKKNFVTQEPIMASELIRQSLEP